MRNLLLLRLGRVERLRQLALKDNMPEKVAQAHYIMTTIAYRITEMKSLTINR